MNSHLVQVATLVHAVTHFLAAKRALWDQLDALHASFADKLCAFASRTRSSYASRLAAIDASLETLLHANTRTSESAHGYYLERSAQQIAPAGCNLLYAVAAAAHCEGTCSDASAQLMRLAAVGGLDRCQAENGPLVAKRIQKLVAHMGTRHDSAACAVWCSCRAALCTSLASNAAWPAELLASKPRDATADLAVRQAPVGERRYVVVKADRLHNANVQSRVRPSMTASLRVSSVKHSAGAGAKVLLQADLAMPAAVTYVMGCVRQSAATLAALAVAAEAWVHDDAEWDILAQLERVGAGSAACVEGPTRGLLEAEAAPVLSPSYQFHSDRLGDIGCHDQAVMLVYAVAAEADAAPRARITPTRIVSDGGDSNTDSGDDFSEPDTSGDDSSGDDEDE